MKKILAPLLTAICVALLAISASAADTITIKGDASCTKCAMHETDKCGCAIKGADGVIYYAEKNDVAKNFHESICKGPAKVVATGTVSDKDGKKVITLTKIEVAK